jgi:ribosomal-protein-alanine N-acetyltransferase
MPLPATSPALEGARIRLRQLSEDDTGDMHAVYSDEVTMAYWSNTPAKTLEETRQLVKRDVEAAKNGRALFWAIEMKETGAVIGKCTLWRYDENNQRAEVGYILNRQYWRMGLMNEALEAMIDYAFSGLGLHRLEADTDTNNAASLALLEKLGFQREGYFRERWYVNGQRQDSVMLGLLEQDWAGRALTRHASLR